MQRKDIEIRIAGTTLRGWLYRPDAAGRVPVVVMAHGFTAVKEMHLDDYAAVFASAGLGVVAYDHRNFGASGGEPRQEVDPWQQIRDWRDVITWATTQPGLDAARIGVWGSSYAGGHALVLGAIDRRVRCVVSQVPLVSGLANARRMTRADLFAPTRAMFDVDRAQRFAGTAPVVIPVVSADAAVPCALPTADSLEWFTRTGVEKRGHAALDRDDHRVRARRLYRRHQPYAAVDGGGHGRPFGRERYRLESLRPGGRTQTLRVAARRPL